MPHAVTLRLDDSASTAIRDLWGTLADRRQGAAAAFAYVPHLTLAVIDGGVDEHALIAAVGALAARLRPPALSLASLGLFLAPHGGTVFLAPVPDADLLACHAAVQAALPAGLIATAHTRTGAWVPHVTLADAVARPAEAVAALETTALPLPAMGVALDVVRFHPVDILASLPLGGC